MADGHTEGGILEIGDGNFEAEVLKSPVPVLVDFWAEWCAPCRAIAPTLSELAREYAGRLKVVKVNVDENPATPSRYGVRAIPTVLLVEGGEVRGQLQGARPRSAFVELIEQGLGGGS